MLKAQEIHSTYNLNDAIIITDQAHPFYNNIGTIVRIGSAGAVIFYHIIIQGISTPLTLYERQVKRYELS